MKNDGKAAIIIGGHNFDTADGRMQTHDKMFFNYLYSHYNVTHNIEISGDVFRKMGASFPIRLITLEGRKATPDKQFAPYKKEQVETAQTFDEVRGILAKSVKPATITANIETEATDEGKAELEGTSGKAGKGVAGVEEARPEGSGAVSGGARPAQRSGATTGKGGQSPGGRSGVDTGRPGQPRGDGERGDADRGLGGNEGVRPLEPSERVPSKQSGVENNEYQIGYAPQSSGNSGLNLIPKNMAEAVSRSLKAIEAQHGSIDEYVMKALEYKNLKELHKALSADCTPNF